MDTQARWRETAEALAAEGALPGIVTLVTDGERTRDVVCAGYADMAGGRRMMPETVFWIASMTKPFTGVAALLLEDEGKLSLDDPIVRYLPQFTNHATVTLRQCLCHVSGFPFLTDTVIDAVSLAEKMPVYAALEPLFPPGTQYQYGNVGMNTVARIIEMVSGCAFDVFLRRRIFEPLGMTQTDFWLTPEQERRLAQCYTSNEAQTAYVPSEIVYLSRPYTDRRTRFPEAGGGLFSVAEDMGCFVRMLLRGGTVEGKRFLSEASMKALTTKQTPECVDVPYAVGMKVEEESYGHAGALNTFMSVVPRAGCALVYMVQLARALPRATEAPALFKAMVE